MGRTGCFGAAIAAEAVARTNTSESANFELVNMACLRAVHRDGGGSRRREFLPVWIDGGEVAGSRGWYNPHWHYDHEPKTRAGLDLIAAGHFSRYEPGIFVPILDTLLKHGDRFMHLADLYAYLNDDRRACDVYADSRAWASRAILNIAGSDKFSSDRTIAEYATISGMCIPPARLTDASGACGVGVAPGPFEGQTPSMGRHELVDRVRPP